MRVEDKLRLIELRRSGRSIASLTREFGVSRSTILRVLDDEYGIKLNIELNARCAEMLARGVGRYEVADYRRSVLKGEKSIHDGRKYDHRQ